MGFARKDFKMENAKEKTKSRVEMSGDILLLMKEFMEKQIKEELESIGKEDLWEEIEQYAKARIGAELYVLIKDKKGE